MHCQLGREQQYFVRYPLFNKKNPTLKQPKEIQIIVGPTPPGCAARAACPAPPVQERGDPGVPAQQEWGPGSPPQVGTAGTWDEPDMQKQNFKSQHRAVTNPSLPGVSITWMPMCLHAKFLSFWHENPGFFFFLCSPVCAGTGLCPMDGGTGGLGREVLAWLVDICASHDQTASTY